MLIYFDSGFSPTELIEYVVPLIIDINNEKFVDFSDYAMINFNNLEFVKNEIYNDINMNVFKANNIQVNNSSLEKLTKTTFEIFKIRNFVAKNSLKTKFLKDMSFLKAENSLSDKEIIISLNTNFLLDHPEIFSEKYSEKFFEVLIYYNLEKIARKFSYEIKTINTLIYKITFSENYSEFITFWNEFNNLNKNLNIDFLNKSKCIINQTSLLFEYLPSNVIEKLLVENNNNIIKKIHNKFQLLEKFLKEGG